VEGGGQAAHRVLSAEEIEHVVLALRRVDQVSAWQRVLEIGRLVFDEVVGGNEVEWRSRRGQKDVSLRKLVQHAACPFRKSTLSSAVNVLLFVRQHPQTPELTGITPTHVVQVLGLKPKESLDLLLLAATRGWSARNLGREVRVLRKAQGERRGRPAATGSERAETIGRRASKDLQAMRVLLADCAFVDEESRLRLKALLEEVSELAQLVSSMSALASRASSVILPLAKVSESARKAQAS
jgi:hypothetical protein